MNQEDSGLPHRTNEVGIPAEMMKNIRRIQIKTSHLVDDMFAGRWHSAFKGRGMEFEEVRPYQFGDDVRSIDWNVTARANEPFIKLFREERELSVVLLIDISRSQNFGSQQQTKRQLVAEVAATLAFSAIKNSDQVGMTLFSDRIEKSLAPKKGPRHVLRLIRELLFTEPIGNTTDITVALQHLNRTSSRRRVVFLISDFQDHDYEQTLRIARRKHDVIPVWVIDPREQNIPSVGMVRLRNPETGDIVCLDTLSHRHRTYVSKLLAERIEAIESMFRRLKLTPLQLIAGQDFVEPLTRYFDRRHARS